MLVYGYKRYTVKQKYNIINILNNCRTACWSHVTVVPLPSLFGCVYSCPPPLPPDTHSFSIICKPILNLFLNKQISENTFLYASKPNGLI